jgi:molybdate transport system substrate-binding protein
MRETIMEETVRVLSTYAFKGAVIELAEPFQSLTGLRIDADFAPTLGLLKRLRDGETADVLILTQEGLDELIEEGTVAADSKHDLARSHVGVAVKAGHAHPDISSEAAFVAAVLAARSVAYSKSGASGIFFAQLIGRLGIASQINAKATVTGGLTAERLITDDANLAVQQISELKQVAGVEIVGPIPLSLQTPAVFSAGRMTGSKRPSEADRLLRYLASREVAPVLRACGLEP